MTTPLRPSPLAFNSGRESPFKRQNSSASNSPVTVRATTPTQSPTKPAISSNLSPTKSSSLSPEKPSPFVRRPSQISQTADSRPSSPFARPTSSTSNYTAPSREISNASRPDFDTLAPWRAERQQSIPPEDDTPVSVRPPLSPSPFDGPPSPAQASPSLASSARAGLRPAAGRTATASSTPSTVRAPAPPNFRGNTAGHNNIPPPLLRSMRESFEVLDSSNSGNVTSASVSSMLEQIGLESNLSSIKEFFPSNGPSQLNLARYLDTLSGPMSELSPPEELAAAFSAFDVDDSGQIDVAELRKALLDTRPEPGEEMIRFSERDVDGILSLFSARRAFGAKGTNVAKGKGDVFRYKDFMSSITGGGAEVGAAQEVDVQG